MSILNWDLILQELDEQPWIKEFDELVIKVFVGRKRNLYPSGKEYLCFDWEENKFACERCKNRETPCSEESPCYAANKLDGETYHCDLCLDRMFDQSLTAEAAERNLDIIYKPHNSNIIFVGRYKPISQKSDE
jgi:hypothetical protein